MIIGNQEYRFALTVRASLEISKMCPEGKMENIDRWLDGNDETVVSRFAKMAVVMNKAAIMQEHLGQPVTEWEHIPCLTEEMVLDLPFHQYKQMRAEMYHALRGDSAVTVAVEPEKKRSVKKTT